MHHCQKEACPLRITKKRVFQTWFELYTVFYVRSFIYLQIFSKIWEITLPWSQDICQNDNHIKKFSIREWFMLTLKHALGKSFVQHPYILDLSYLIYCKLKFFNTFSTAIYEFLLPKLYTRNVPMRYKLSLKAGYIASYLLWIDVRTFDLNKYLSCWCILTLFVSVERILYGCMFIDVKTLHEYINKANSELFQTILAFRYLKFDGKISLPIILRAPLPI